MKKTSLFKKVLSVFLTLVMVFTMIPAITFVFKEKETAHAYGTYSKQKSTEYYYASGTKFIASGILYYSSDGNSDATDWLSDNGWTPLGVNFNAGDGKSSKYIHYGVKYTTNPVGAITGYAVRDASDRPNSYSGKTYNGTNVTWYCVGSGAAGITPTGGDGVVDLNKGGGGNDLTLYATNAYEAGPAVTSATHYQGGNGENTRNNLLNGGYTPAQDQNGNWQDCNEGQGGDYLYWGYKSSCTTVNSDNLRTAYAAAKNYYENGGSGQSGLSTALTNAENTLSDLNDGYTTRSQSTINSYTKALYDAMPAVSAIHSYTASVPAGQERWYKFTPSATGTYSFYSTDAYVSTKDPYIEISTWNGSSMSVFASNDDCGDSTAKSLLGLDSRQSYLSATFNAGTTYYVKWRHWTATENGDIHFTVTVPQGVSQPISPIHSYTATISAGGEKWYTFTPTVTGTYAFYSTDDYDANRDPVIEIYTWNGSALASFASNDDCGDSTAKSLLGLQTRQSYLSATFTAGTTYCVKWRHYNTSEAGDINFTLTVPQGVSQPISPIHSYTATISAGGEKWYTFTPSTTGTYVFYSNDAYTTTMDPVIEIYTWNGSALASFASNDDCGDSTVKSLLGLQQRQSYLSATFTAGTTYCVKWKHYHATDAGDINFVLTVPEGVSEAISPTNSYAASVSAGGEKWYRFTPSASGTYALYSTDAYTTDMDPVVTVYKWNGTAFETYANNDDGDATMRGYIGLQTRQSYLAAAYDAGTTYYVQWKHYNDTESGTINFRLADVVAVTISPNGGGSNINLSLPKGSELDLSKFSVSRTDYIHLGWSASATATSATWQPTGTYPVTSAATVYAVWIPTTYAVTLDNQGATTAGSTVVTATYNAAMPSATMPTKTGYTFGGYYDGTNGSGTQYYTAAGASARTWNKTAATTLYAKWTINSYTITFKGADGTVLKTQTVNYGVTPTAPSIPAKAADATYHYTGAWDKTIAAASANTTYTVVYTAIPHSGGTANCVDKAVCTNCGTAYGSVNANNHKSVVNDAKVDATCVSTGLTAGKHCSACNAVITTQNTIDKLDHSYTGAVKDNENGTHSFKCVNGCNEYGGTVNCTFGEWTTTTAPGCTTTGKKEHTCSVCGYKAEADIEATGHTMTKTAAKAATCTETGNNEYYTCSVCNKVYKDEAGTTETTVAVETLAKLDHSYTGAVKNNNDGTHSFKCVNGCDQYGGTVDCEYESAVKTPATCTEMGTTTYTCKVCGYTYNAQDINALGHTMTKTAAKDATCTETGNNEYYTCSVCEKVFKDEAGATETSVEAETLAALGHTMTKTAAKDATCTETGNNEYYTCSVCEKVFKDEAGATETTVEAETLAALGHTMNKIAAKDATCTETGNNEYYTCSVCEKVFKDEAGATETTVEAETLAALGHTMTKIAAKDATCTETGNNEYYTCSVCEKVFKDEAGATETTVEAETLAALGHAYGDLIDEISADCQNTGVAAHYVCSVCEKIFTADKTEVASLDALEIAIAPDVHVNGTYTKDENIVDATCIAKGSYDLVTYCSDCDAELGREAKEIAIDADNHVGETYTQNENVIDATCVITGEYDLVTYCSDCNAKLDTEHKTGVKAPDNHVGTTYTADENIVDATCIAKGSYDLVTYCSDCGAELSREAKEIAVDPTAHTGNNHTENYLDSTCTEVGYTGDTVCECGAVLENGIEIALKAHAYGDWEVTLAATCMAKGTERRTCVNCPAYEERDIDIDPDNHTNVTHLENDKPATCTEVGYTGDTYCECGAMLIEGTEIGMEAHAYGEWETVTAATCMAKGLAKRVCADCPAFETKELDIDPANHTGNNHTENYLDSTCTEVGYTGDTVCECGTVLENGTEIALKAHTYGAWEVTLAATCMAKGTERHTCVNCPAYEERDVAIDPANHTGNNTYDVGKTAPTCTKKGYTGDTVCECGAIITKGKEIGMLPHDYAVTSEIPATFEKEGKRVYTCTVCGAEKEETLAKSATCEYCGTDHQFFLARAICYVIKAIYHMIGLFTAIDF